jgi:hypothetical protein
MKLPNLITIMNREIQSNRTHTRPILHYRIQDTITSYSRDAEYQNTLFFFCFWRRYIHCPAMQIYSVPAIFFFNDSISVASSFLLDWGSKMFHLSAICWLGALYNHFFGRMSTKCPKDMVQKPIAIQCWVLIE